jgi:hypothetical protein
MAIPLETVNYHLLRKSHLLPGTECDTAADVLNDFITLDAGSLPEACFSVSLRAKKFDITAFESEINKGWSLARAWGLKGSMQIMSRQAMPAIYAVTKASRDARSASSLKNWGIADEERVKVEKAITASLAGKEKTLSQLKNGMPAGLSRDIVRARGKKKEKSTNVGVVASAMWDRWELLRGGAGRTPLEDPGRFSLFTDRFRSMPQLMERTKAFDSLAAWYVVKYGPVCPADLTWWCGIPVKDAETSLKKTGASEMEIQDVKGTFFIMEEDLRSLEAEKPATGNITMLPQNDPYVKAYSDRSRFVHPLHVKDVMNRFGDARSSLLVDGVVMGTWDVSKDMEWTVLVNAYCDVSRIESEIEKKSIIAGRFFTGGSVRVLIK